MSAEFHEIAVVESPFAAENAELRAEYDAYLDQLLNWCIHRGWAPFASHGLYTRPGVLDDNEPAERSLGIRAGLYLAKEAATVVVVGIDYGLSSGMCTGLAHHLATGKMIMPVQRDYRGAIQPALVRDLVNLLDGDELRELVQTIVRGSAQRRIKTGR